jgi:hypothetical protein
MDLDNPGFPENILPVQDIVSTHPGYFRPCRMGKEGINPAKGLR